MIDTKKYNGLKEKIDEKEKILIENISTQVAESISDSISDSLDDISNTLSAADEKAQGLSESIGSLSQNIQTLSSFDFSEQFTKVKDSQQALEQASKDAKSVFDESKDANNKLIEEIAKSLIEWKSIYGNLMGIVGNIDAESESLENAISTIERSSNSLSSINEEIIDTMKKVESKQLSIVEQISEQTSTAVETIVNNKIECSSNQLQTMVKSSSGQLEQLIMQLAKLSKDIEKNLNTIIDKTNAFSENELQSKLSKLEVIEENNKNILVKVEEIESKYKLTPLSIATTIMGGIIIVLNVILLLIK